MQLTLTQRSTILTVLLATAFLRAQSKPESAPHVYSCAAQLPKGAVRLDSGSRFKAMEAGWDINASPAVKLHAGQAGACSSSTPFFFSFPASDETFQVTVALGGAAASVMTVRAESRKLMLLNESIAANKTRVFTFNVAARTPFISPGQQVKLKPREVGDLSWDEKVTLEFNGTNPSVRSITIRPISVPTIYLAGDSTVVDQAKEPWTAWGQILPVFFNDRIAIANEAESGETIRSFVGEGRLAKIMSTIHAGDYLFVQFAHNDQKLGSGFVSIPQYKDYLRSYIDQARAKGATPILVTSMNRRTFDDKGKIQPSLGEYPAAMRDVAAEKSVDLIDLNAMSKTLYEALGPQTSLKVFVHYPANSFPGQPQELKDDTHFSGYGAYELARAIVSRIQEMNLPLANYLRRDIAPFDLSHPDPVETFNLPASPFVSAATPYELSDNKPAAIPQEKNATVTTDPGQDVQFKPTTEIDPKLPTIWLVGDSTVRNGHGDGANNQMGWGDELASFFDLSKVNVINRAIGGRSSRTYITEGRWDEVLSMMKPGDIVLIQFGHNDPGPLDDAARARGSLAGVGDETREIENPVLHRHETVHTFGWYMTKYVQDAKAHGVIPILCSQIPRKIWNGDTIIRSTSSYAGWTRTVAETEHVAFVDLNEIIARRYDSMGKAAVEPLFGDEHTHTTALGATLNAEAVVAGLKALKDDPVAKDFSPRAGTIPPFNAAK